MSTKRSILAATLAVAASLAMVGCSAATPSPSSTSTSEAPATSTTAPAANTWMAPPKAGPYKVALSDSFTSNTWRAQVTMEFNNYCQTNTDKVTCLTPADANSDTATQISQITAFIQQGADIILIDANDGSALNDVIQQATEAGIQVVDFDNTTTSTYAIHVGEDQTEVGKQGATWLVSQLKPGDKIISLDGITGNPTSDQRQQGADAVFAANNITIVGRGDTKWDKATAQSLATTLLTANPDIQGIYSQGGDSSLGAIAAQKQLGMKLLPIPGEGSNGFLKAWQSNNLTSWAFASPPQLVINALETGIAARQGTDPGNTVNLPIPTITQDTLAQNVHPDLNDNLWLPTMLPDSFLQQNFAN
ncbi:MAG: substrate-binding domain-containing protein [Propionibacteriaceae bacterium]|nr:substrate-binding domain-containing protein [Propionibacteriaceae bacterium]